MFGGLLFRWLLGLFSRFSATFWMEMQATEERRMERRGNGGRGEVDASASPMGSSLSKPPVLPKAFYRALEEGTGSGGCCKSSWNRGEGRGKWAQNPQALKERSLAA